LLDRAEEVDGLEPGVLGDRWRPPEAAHAVTMRGVFDLHMRGELVGKPADLAPAHGIGLAGEQSGPLPGLPMRPVSK
jgi:hypothetical protein